MKTTQSRSPELIMVDTATRPLVCGGLWIVLIDHLLYVLLTSDMIIER